MPTPDLAALVATLGVPAVVLVASAMVLISAAVALWRFLKLTLGQTYAVYDRWLADKDREIEYLRAENTRLLSHLGAKGARDS